MMMRILNTQCVILKLALYIFIVKYYFFVQTISLFKSKILYEILLMERTTNESRNITLNMYQKNVYILRHWQCYICVSALRLANGYTKRNGLRTKLL